jgi:PAT family beta-lactamase induction signal transducer AmpG
LKTSFYKDLGKEFWIFKKLSYAKWIGLLILLSMIILILYKKRLKSKLVKNRDSFYAESFLSFIDREKIGYAIAFIILVRTGEFMLHAMTGSFMVDLGLKNHIGWIVAGVGLPASIVGALLGGWLISKYGFKKMAFPLLLIQNLTNLLYMWLAYYLNNFIKINNTSKAVKTIFIGGQNLFFVTFVNGFEQFSAGLGTAVLTIYLLNLCIKEFKTAHFALGTGLMSVSGIIAGILGGIIAQDYGYTIFFLISFLVAIPSMILLFMIPHYKKEDNLKLE